MPGHDKATGAGLQMGIVGVVFAGSFAAFLSWRLAQRWKRAPHYAEPGGALEDDGADQPCRLSITGKQEIGDISTELGLKCIASDELCSAQDSTLGGQSTRDSSCGVAALPDCDFDMQIAGEEGSLNCSLPVVQVAGSLGVVAAAYDESVLAGSSRIGRHLGHTQVCRDGGGDGGDILQACMVQLQDPKLDGATAQSRESGALAEESGKPKFSFSWCTREEHMEEELDQRTFGRLIPAEGSRGSTATRCARGAFRASDQTKITHASITSGGIQRSSLHMVHKGRANGGRARRKVASAPPNLRGKRRARAEAAYTRRPFTGSVG